MELTIVLAVTLTVISCGVLFLIVDRFKKRKPIQPLLGVVAPQKSQNAPESTKTVRKVK